MIEKIRDYPFLSGLVAGAIIMLVFLFFFPSVGGFLAGLLGVGCYNVGTVVGYHVMKSMVVDS